MEGNGKCPVCRTKLDSQFIPRGILLFCPDCGYENILPYRLKPIMAVK